MEILRQYVMSIVAASILSGIILGFFQSSTVKQLLKMLCGLFLAFAVMRPIQQFDVSDLAIPGTTEAREAQELAAMGEEMALDALRDIIKAETEAYILDKAAQLNVDLEVQVTVSGDDPPIPVSVTLTGPAAPYAKQRLEAVLTQELGIPKENQTWTGEA